MCNRLAANLMWINLLRPGPGKKKEHLETELLPFLNRQQPQSTTYLFTGRTQCSPEVTQENAAGMAPTLPSRDLCSLTPGGTPQLELTGCRMAAENLGRGSVLFPRSTQNSTALRLGDRSAGRVFKKPEDMVQSL